MGITFRSGSYIKFVFLGGRTIKDGEAAAVWNRRGEHKQIVGPRRIILFHSTIRFLTRFKAEVDQYLKIMHRDGTVEHIQGPIQMYLNPSYHDEIKVLEGIKLKENEVIQVSHLPQLHRSDVEYNTDGTSMEKGEEPLHKESSRFVCGPALFIPAEDEIVEVFEWTGLPKEIGGIHSLDSKSKMKFSTVELHTKRVWKVKVAIGSSESTKVIASLAITYKIDSIAKVTLHSDPCASVCVALMGDIQDLFQEDKSETSSSGSFQEIQADVAWKLSGSKSFPTLMGMGEAIGFSIESVQVLEIAPGQRLQRQISEEHDREMTMKAQVANKESEIRFQELELEDQRKRMENQVELSRKEAKMQSDLAEELHLQKMAALDQECELMKKREQQKIESWEASDEAVLKFLGGLKGLGVDVSKYMCTDSGQKASAVILKRAPSLAPAWDEKSDKKEEMTW
eukprot:scaffold6683_cov103-Cylindrotheca_fusiformis.AAC.6